MLRPIWSPPECPTKEDIWDSITLSGWMKSLKNAISKTLKNATFRAPHWQKGFFDHVIRSQEFYDQKWFYVRDNPVRAGLVQSAEDWP